MALECDVCDGTEYTQENPHVRYCVRRPSDKSDMCCTMWGHWNCLGGKGPYVPILPTVAQPGNSAVATYADLERWIETPDARKNGFIFIT